MDALRHEHGISVVISTYNRPFLALSLIRQLMGQVGIRCPFEILVVSDGSQDGVLQVLTELTSDSLCSVRFFDSMATDDYGLALCRNIGIRFARYDRLVFLDDDLSVGPDFLAQYEAAPEGLCLGRVDCITERADAFEVVRDQRGMALRGETRALNPWKPWLGFLWGANFCVPTRYAMAVGGIDLAFINEGQEDTDFGARLMYFLSGVYVVPRAVATHYGPVSNHRTEVGVESEPRPAKASQRFSSRKSMIVNGGLRYWKGAQWEQFCR